MNKTFTTLLIGLAAFLFMSVASAAPCAVTDVTYESSNADDCAGPIAGNDNESNIGFTGFDFIVKDETSPDTYMGIEFTLTGITAGTSGNWTLGWSDAGDPLDLPLTMDLVFVVKASDSFSSYLFEEVDLIGDPGSGSGTWEVTFLNNGGQIPNISHASIYGKVTGEPPCTVDCEPPPCTVDCNNLTEPTTFGLLMMGLVGTFVTRRRKN
ncbi:MAG: PEP-CTERM sorting domain-containing protein [Gammaproteobacteria bacterium]|nr:PEP-CTERM sorting domain-containing protein [Gammaproteobacteria bacterium]